MKCLDMGNMRQTSQMSNALCTVNRTADKFLRCTAGKCRKLANKVTIRNRVNVARACDAYTARRRHDLKVAVFPNDADTDNAARCELDFSE